MFVDLHILNVKLYIHQGNLFHKRIIQAWGFYDRSKKSTAATQKHGL